MPEHADALNRPNRNSESRTLHMNYSESQPSPSPETFQAHLAAVPTPNTSSSRLPGPRLPFYSSGVGLSW